MNGSSRRQIRSIAELPHLTGQQTVDDVEISDLDPTFECSIRLGILAVGRIGCLCDYQEKQ